MNVGHLLMSGGHLKSDWDGIIVTILQLPHKTRSGLDAVAE